MPLPLGSRSRRILRAFSRGLGSGELHCYSILACALFGDAHNLCALGRIKCSGRAGIGEGDVENLAFPIASTGGSEKQAVARNVDALADFFKRHGRIDGANENLRGNFRALAAAAFYPCGIIGSGLCFGVCASS